MTVQQITVDPAQMGGAPCIRGLRFTVRRVLDILATYPERAELFREFPDLEEEDLRQAGEVSHVRFNIYPDGGVGRLRLFGRPR